ncbi:MAG: GTP-binding protein [Candidatus Lokiarchaeota archaeon]|nr:GTP-binding protein [Candidatus Lokiarchaeota archaeon]
MKHELVYGIVFSKHDEKMGPIAVSWVPAEIDEEARNQVSKKSMNLCSGGGCEAMPKGVELITFPALELKGLIKCILLNPAGAPDCPEYATITMLFSDAHDAVFYKYIESFNPEFNEAAKHFQAMYEKDASAEDYASEIENFLARVMELLEELYKAEMPAGGKTAFAMSDQSAPAKRVYRYKVVVIGDPEVGKTSMILRFTENVFRKTYIMSIGVNVTTKIIELGDVQVEFVIWDVAGQSKFDLARRSFYEGASGQLLVFDLTRPVTFENVPKWHRDIALSLKKNISGFVIGNKSDLTSQIAVGKDEIDPCVEGLGLDYIEASALTGKNIQAAFIKLAQSLVPSAKK